MSLLKKMEQDQNERERISAAERYQSAVALTLSGGVVLGGGTYALAKTASVLKEAYSPERIQERQEISHLKTQRQQAVSDTIQTKKSYAVNETYDYATEKLSETSKTPAMVTHVTYSQKIADHEQKIASNEQGDNNTSALICGAAALVLGVRMLKSAKTALFFANKGLASEGVRNTLKEKVENENTNAALKKQVVQPCN